MDDEQKKGLSDTAQTASTIHGAIKTGKAIAGAAKGTAGGPYGAAAALLLENRKHIKRLVVVIGGVLLIPILFLLLLLGLILGGFSVEIGEAQTEIWSNNEAIIQHVNALSAMIDSVLQEGIQDVTIRIEADFAYSGGDQREIVNPYESTSMYNANLFISQYCAFREKDFKSIHIQDLERILRENKRHLYHFTRREEVRMTTGIDPETGEETTYTELWMIYTIVYSGEAYFADQVFSLSDKQKALAADYASNMSLFLRDGMFQGLSDSVFLPGASYDGVTFGEGATAVVYFNQGDERFKNKPYGTDRIGSHGCGPTSMSIVVSSLTDETVDPIQMSAWAYQNGYWCSGSGSYHSLIPGAATAWGLPVSGCTAGEPQRIVDALRSGKLVVAIMAKGHFTSGGHFIVLRGVTAGGKILVADPASYKRSEQEWDLSIILNEASRRAGAGGPFWIIG